MTWCWSILIFLATTCLSHKHADKSLILDQTQLKSCFFPPRPPPPPAPTTTSFPDYNIDYPDGGDYNIEPLGRSARSQRRRAPPRGQKQKGRNNKKQPRRRNKTTTGPTSTTESLPIVPFGDETNENGPILTNV